MHNLKKNNKKFLNNLYSKIEKPFFEQASIYGWHLFIKSCMEVCGFMRREERLPLLKLNAKDHNEVRKFIFYLQKISKKYLKKNYFEKIKL